MKSRRILLALMARKWILFLLIILFSTSKSESQTNVPQSQAGLLCISDCETCPVICSPPPSSSSPATPKSPLPPPPSPLPLLLPPPPVHHHHSPPQPYYFASPPLTSPPAHPPPSPRSGGSGVAIPPPQSIIPWGGAFPTPPSVYGYNPGNVGQRNFSYPYYYFYASKASCYLPFHQGSILLMLFIFLQVLF